MKIMATLPEYNLGWESGTDRMSLISIGTGGVKGGRAKHVLDVLAQAKNLPTALIGSFQAYQDLLCRVHGECRYGLPVDGEVGALIGGDTGISGKPDFLYARYDKVFNDQEILDSEEVTKAGFTLDNLELMDFLCEKGAEHAEEIVKLEHFEND
jgi:uncharacterized protein